VLEDGVSSSFVTSAASAAGRQHLSRHRAERAALHGGGFVDIGRGRNGVLYAGEVNWEAPDSAVASRKIESAQAR